MVKEMKKIFLIIMILSSFITVKAYENDYFKVDIPDGYNLTSKSNNTYKWDKENNYIAITVSNNSETKYNIKYYTDEDIENQKNYIEKRINEGLAKYNIKSTVSNIRKDNIDDIYFIEYDLYLPSKKAIGYDTYQKGRIYSLDKYLITLIYNNDSQIKEEEYNTFINSFTIKDIAIDTKIKRLIIAAIVIGVVSGIIGYFVSLKKKKH